MTISLGDLNSHEQNDWCPQCGDMGILLAVKNAIIQAGLDQRKVVDVSGIGCSSKLPNFVNINGIHTLHGRAIPFAEGVKIANPELTVLVNAGDGDTYGIGVGHFISVGRRNTGIKLLIHDNGVYGLTKGQVSPTLPENRKVKGWPDPNINSALDPLSLAIIAGYTFVARAQSYNVKEQTGLIVEAMKHRGLALIDILQGCPTYNPEFTSSAWFASHTTPLPGDYDGRVGDPGDMDEVDEKKLRALSVLMAEKPDGMHTGLFFQWENPDTFEERLRERKMQPPIDAVIEDSEGRSTIDLSKTIDDLGV